MDSSRAYTPRPRRGQAIGEANITPKLPTSEVEVRIFTGIHHISMVHIVHTMIYGVHSASKLVYYRVYGMQCAPKLATDSTTAIAEQ